MRGHEHAPAGAKRAATTAVTVILAAALASCGSGKNTTSNPTPDADGSTGSVGTPATQPVPADGTVTITLPPANTPGGWVAPAPPAGVPVVYIQDGKRYVGQPPPQPSPAAPTGPPTGGAESTATTASGVPSAPNPQPSSVACGTRDVAGQLPPQVPLTAFAGRLCPEFSSHPVFKTVKGPTKVERTADGIFMVDFSCNTMTGNTDINGQTVHFSEVMSTMMGCPGRDQPDRAWMEMVQKPLVYRFDGTWLELFDTPTSSVVFKKN